MAAVRNGDGGRARFFAYSLVLFRKSIAVTK